MTRYNKISEDADLQEGAMKKKYSKKKYIIIGGVLAMILIIGFVFAKDYVSLNKKTLKRDYDTESEQGSNIKTQELSECQVESLYKEIATQSSILAWRTPRTEEPTRLQSTGSQRVRHTSE